jgi:metal-sulfur cluster biosynthetic enzyme
LVQEERGHVDVQNVDTVETVNAIIENLKQVFDPEISVNIYDLGLIYKIDISSTLCTVTMSLTSAFCPAADQIVEDVHYAALNVHGVNNVQVNVTFDPPWGPEMMSDDAKLLLGFY